ncbi:MAG: 4-hydroxy-tetrahydrodipicolinate reductase [Cetobacterium sp.]|uniref:4-hydroxy-tetrahydrodipicolinate reductase n=1 Tax=Cetobacterium sp. TaxID=2071632 RepID=UPI002FC766A7
MKLAVHGKGTMGKILQEIGEEKVKFFVDDISEIPKDETVDVVIDFSHFSKIEKLLEECMVRNYPIVIATTGYSGDILSKIVKASEIVPILLSSNTSLGINAMQKVLKEITPKLQDGFDIEIIEKHHNKKIDAPSGTAKAILSTIESSLNERYDVKYGREGICKREKKEITVHAVRGGTIVGEHTVIFAGEDEIIEVTHKALSKKIFAVGALKCAEFLKDKKPGLYTMDEIFN